MDKNSSTIIELQSRWDKIRIANLYDTLDEMGLANPVMDLSIRPLFPRQHLAGKAITLRGGRDPLSREEMQREQSENESANMFELFRNSIYPGSVIIVESGGAMGIIIDSFIRDRPGLEVIPDYTACAIGTSPIEAIAEEALSKSEDIELREKGMREDLSAGMSFEDAFEKWGRA